jgi:hypothetical protein
MRIIGCDLHVRQQTLAMLDTTTGEVVKTTLQHEGNNVREFYCKLPRPVRVGIEATGSMQWFVNLMEELRIEIPSMRNAPSTHHRDSEQRTVRRNSEFGTSGGFELSDERASVLYWNGWHKRRLRFQVR